MSSWWSYTPRSDYLRRRAERWRQESSAAVFRALARANVRQAGIDPDLIPGLAPPIQVDVSDLEEKPIQPPRQQKSTGLFGKVKGRLGDITETVFRGPVNKPWDVLRPVQQAFEFEQEKIARPLAKNVTAAIAAVPIALVEDVTIQEAFKEAKEEYEELPGVVKLGAEIAFSPSTWVPFGILAKGGKIASKAPILSTFFRAKGSRQALTEALRIAGGSDEAGSIAGQANHLVQTLFHVSDPDVIVREAVANRSWASRLRNHFGARLSDSNPELFNWLSNRGMRLYDDDTAIILDYALRELSNYASSSSAAMREIVRPALGYIRHGGAFAFRRDELGNEIVTNVIRVAGAKVPKEATLDYIAWNAAKYKLTKAQRAALELTDNQLQVFRELRKAMGVKVKEITPPPGGYYFHRQAISRLETITDPVSLVEFERRVSAGPAIARRLGAKQAFQKPRVVRDSVEGIRNRVHYMDFDEAQELLARQEILASRDKWLLDMLKEQGKTPVELLPEGVQARLVTARARLERYRRLANELSRNVRVPAYKGWQASAIRGLRDDPDLGRFVMRAEAYTVLPRKAERKAMFQQMLDEVRGKSPSEVPSTEAVRGQVRGAVGKYRKEMGKIQAERGVPGFRREFRGRFFPEYPGVELERLERGRQLGQIDRQISGFNSFFRPVMATLDLSFMGIQGLLGLARHPLQYMQTLKVAMSSEGAEALVKSSKASGLLDRFLEAGGHWFSREDFAEFALPRLIREKIPLAAVSNRAFSRFNNVLRLKMFEAGELTVPAKELARYVNLMTGFTTSEPSSVEGLMFFAPRYFRSQLTLAGDALTRWKVGDDVQVLNRSRQALLRLIASGTILTWTVNEATGQKTDWEPGSPNFLRIRAMGQDISVFGPWDSLVRSVFTLVRDGPETGLKYFVRSKASPLMGRVYDLIGQETFKGEKLDWSNPIAMASSMALLLKQLGPIGIQQSLESGLPSTPEELAAAAIQFTGMKATPLTEWEKVSTERDVVARDTFGKSWGELEPYQKLQLREANRGLEYRAKRAAWAERADIHDAFGARQEMLDKAFPPGRDWIESYQSLRDKQAGAYEDWARRHPDEAKEMVRTDSDDPGFRALAEYYEAFRTSRTDYGGLNPELLDARMAELEASWTAEQKAFVERNTGIYGTPRVKEYKAAQKLIRPYWEIRDQVWAKMQISYPKLAPYATPDDYEKAMSEELVKKGVPQEQLPAYVNRLPVLNYLGRISDRLRQRYRLAHPDVDRALLTWGYVSTTAKLPLTRTR